jgi:VWFA-related protein
MSYRNRLITQLFSISLLTVTTCFAEDTVTSRQVKGVGEAGSSEIIINQVEISSYPKVTIFATVLKNGEPQKGLGASDFKIREDEVEQEPITVESKLTPLSVVVALDVSGSMNKSLAQAQEAAQSFVSNLGAEDSVSVISFSRSVNVLSTMSANREAAKSAIAETKARGDTALYDALYSSVEVLKGQPGRKAIVLLSDGVDDDGYGNQLSKHSVSDALTLAQEVNVPIFTIGLGSSIDEGILRKTAQETGAQYYNAPKVEDLQALYNGIGKQLSGQYNIFYTSNLPSDGSLRTIQLQQGDIRSAKAYKAPSMGRTSVAAKPVAPVTKAGCPASIESTSNVEQAPVFPLDVGCEFVVPEASQGTQENTYLAFEVPSGKRFSILIEANKSSTNGEIDVLFPNKTKYETRQQYPMKSNYVISGVASQETAGRWSIRLDTNFVKGKIGIYTQDLSDANSSKDAGYSEGTALEINEGELYTGYITKNLDTRDLYLFSVAGGKDYEVKIRPTAHTQIEVTLYDENGGVIKKAHSSNDGAGVTLAFSPKTKAFGSLAVTFHGYASEYYQSYNFSVGPAGFRPPAQPGEIKIVAPVQVVD